MALHGAAPAAPATAGCRGFTARRKLTPRPPRTPRDIQREEAAPPPNPLPTGTVFGIAGVLAGVCSWSFRGSDGRTGAQVDLLLDRKDGIVNLCEMKLSDGPYSIDKKEEETVLRRLSVFRRETGTRKGVHVTFVTPDVLARNSHRDVAQSEVTGDDLFA